MGKIKKVIFTLLVLLSGCFGQKSMIPVPEPGYAIVQIIKNVQIQDLTVQEQKAVQGS